MAGDAVPRTAAAAQATASPLACLVSVVMVGPLLVGEPVVDGQDHTRMAICVCGLSTAPGRLPRGHSEAAGSAARSATALSRVSSSVGPASSDSATTTQ